MFVSRCLGAPLPPIAFAIVMSTGTLACATLSQARYLPWLALPAHVLSWLNFVLFACLCPVALATWLKNRRALGCHCAQPAAFSTLATAGIALIVLAHQCLFFELGLLPALLFWSAGAACSFVVNVALFLRLFLRRHSIAHIAPAVFLPIVALMVLPTGGAALHGELAAPWSGMIELLGVFALGGGLMLYASALPLLVQRHMLLQPLPVELAPTYWIHLAPLGWGGISALSLAHILLPPAAQEIMRFLCLLAWGAAAWWALMAALLTLRALWRHGMAFSLAWWSFIFPLGSFLLLTKMLAIPFALEISFAVWLFMAFIWSVDAVRTSLLAWRHAFPA